ncbi:insulin-like growth factor-binding protein complex acid labile subunit [Uloborus diversus]|uniref:insulin-like growth factor-binding protein complex acid labile subunit n=1 Tax=Uloborus diversus TaxID=327109 RepID=UPI00240A22D2|nr:insulin-like growth factor-binding protein complex acid labile subunit [Uloborus diversus]
MDSVYIPLMHKYKGAVVLCQDMRGPDLEVTLAGLGGLRLKKLELRRVNASSLWGPFRGWLAGDLVLEGVRVEDDSMRRGRHLFRGLESALNSLEMRKMEISSLQLDHLTHLVVLILEDNSIPSVDNDWFTTGPRSLSNLYLARNGIADLGNGAFSALVGLRHLDLSRNEIRIITRSMLPDQDSRLSTLDLSRNLLRDLPDDLFSGMPFIREVDVSGNVLQTMREDIWMPVFNHLEKMNLDGLPSL